MDLVATLAAALDIDGARAEALGASALSSVEAAVRGAAPAAATELAAKIPELGDWKKSGKVVALGSTPVQGLMGFSQLLLDRGLDPAKAMGLGSVVVGFLQSRGALELVTRHVPSVGGLGGAAGGMIASMFGGFGAAGGGKGGSGGAWPA